MSKELNSLIAQSAQLLLEEMRLEEELKAVREKLKVYREDLIPSCMEEMEATAFTSTTGLKVEVQTQVFGSFPKDPERHAEALEYLRRTGNDGLVKRAIIIRYGRNSTAEVEKLKQLLKEANVAKTAVIDERQDIHASSLKKFVKDELKAGHDIPLESFGVFERKVAKIKI